MVYGPTRQQCELDNDNSDDAGAGLSGIEVSAHILIHGKSVTLVAAEREGRRRAVSEKGHKCDLRCAIHHSELHDADKTADR